MEPQTIFEVCRAHGADDPARCLTLWTLFGGVPKYWRHFAETDGLDTVPEWEPWTQQVCERTCAPDPPCARREKDCSRVSCGAITLPS